MNTSSFRKWNEGDKWYAEGVDSFSLQRTHYCGPETEAQVDKIVANWQRQ